MVWHSRLFSAESSGWTILVRLLVGLAVFFPEGLQKLLFPDLLGAGRFARIGIPFPEIMGPFVGMVETVSGALIIVGFATRLAAIPLIIIMIAAILSTKLPILLGHDFWIFHLPESTERVGFWAAEHEARADLCMLLGSIYLLIVGAGRWSIDALLANHRIRRSSSRGQQADSLSHIGNRRRAAIVESERRRARRCFGACLQSSLNLRWRPS